MRSLILAAAPLVILTVAGCVSTGPTYGGSGPYGGYERPPSVQVAPPAPNPHPLARTLTFACEGLTTIVLIEGERSARVTLNSGQELALAQQGPGGVYGGRPYEFRASGSEGVFVTPDRSWRCRVR